MTKPLIHEKALTLRKSGYSIGAIAKKLSVSKSTVSGWCRDIALSEKQILLIAERSKHHATANLLFASEKQRKERQRNTEKMEKMGKREIGKLSLRDIQLIGLGLYWGEGYKKGSQELGFTNSDPAMINFYIEWLEKIYKISKTDLILRVSINNQHSDRTIEVVNYWSTVTNVPYSQFTKTSLLHIHSKKNYENSTTHFGTLRVKVRKGTNLRRRILGSIKAIKIT